MKTLFQTKDIPLAEQMRPNKMSDVVGQDHLLGPEGPIGQMLAAKKITSFILWGPPGCGKTTIAKLMASEVSYHFEAISAVFSGVSELRKVFKDAKQKFDMGKKTVLFVDEIHRFNKAQQDSFLPYIEDGTIVLIGATTENPSFELNSALLSRVQVFTLKALEQDSINILLDKVEEFIGHKLPFTDKSRDFICRMADGDGRFFYSVIEQILLSPTVDIIDRDTLQKILHRKPANYDKSGDQHFNLMSALHKSLRGSDVDASLYWMARMLKGGEDPLYILRRLIRFSVEDIGTADPNALTQATHATEAYERLGSPEGELAIAQCVAYLATAPKSNAVYKAYKEALKVAAETSSLSPPKHILNAPTKLMQEQGYGEGYQYDHDVEDGFSGQNYFPEEMARQRFYQPIERGFERDILKRLAYFDALRQKKAS